MKYLAILLMLLLGIVVWGFVYYEKQRCSPREIKNANSGGPADSFLACTLTNSELVERKRTLLPAIQPFIEDIKELENGYSFQFPNDDALLIKLFEVIDVESKCCRFLEFNLKVEANNGPVSLQLTGPKGTKAFLKENFM